MKHLLLSAVALLSASPALAASYSVGFGAAGPGKTSATGFTGFNSSLGTLTQVDITLSGSTTYDITLSFPPPPPTPPSGTVGYSLKNGLFLYTASPLGNLGPQPYLQQIGVGTAPLTFGSFQATTSGLNGLTTFTDAASLAKFLDVSFSGYIAVDDPFVGTVSVNGGPTGNFIPSKIEIASKSVSGSVLYTYTAKSTALPEPATWATMLIGFGLVGGAVRRRTRGTAALVGSSVAR